MVSLSRAFASVPRFHRDVNLLLAATGLLAISFFGVQTFLKILYVLRLGFGPEYLGLFNASGALSYMAMSLPSGALGDRLGVVRAMFIGAVVTTVGMALLPMSEAVPAWARAGWPILSQLILSGGYAMFSINLVPALMGLTSAQNRNSAYAMSSTLRSLGTFLGTVVGGLLPGLIAGLIGQGLETPAPYRLALWLGPLLGLVALLPLTRIREARPLTVEMPSSLPNGFPMLPMGLLVLFVVFSQSASAVCQAFCNAYMDTELRLTPAAIGLLTGSGQFAAIFAPLFLPRMARRHGNGWTLMVVTLCSAVSIVPLLLLSNWIGAGLGRFGTLALAAMWMPALQVYQMELVDKRWRSLAYGTVSMAMGLSFGILSFAGGYVAAGWGYPALFLMGLLLSTLGATMMWAMLRRPTLMVAAGESGH